MKRFWKPALWCASLALATPLGLTFAEDPLPKPDAADAKNAELFAELDKNADGELAADEVPAEQKRLVARLLRNADKDGNGTLSAAEFTAGLAKKPPAGDALPGGLAGPGGNPLADRINPAQLFKRLDQDGDGKVTIDDVPEERRERLGRLLKMADKDQDGTITEEEFTTGMKRMRELAGGPAPDPAMTDNPPAVGPPPVGPGGPEGPGGPGGPGRPGRPGGPGRPGAMGIGPLMLVLDGDKDGTISADEIANATQALKSLDKNNDGQLDREELRPAGGPRPGPGGEGGPGRPGFFRPGGANPGEGDAPEGGPRPKGPNRPGKGRPPVEPE